MIPALQTFDTSNMPGQREFMESIAKELMYSGSFGAGKSRVGCEKGLFFSLKYPGNRGLICRKTFASLRYTTKYTWDRYVCPPEYIKSYNQETHICTLTNGSEILFLGLDDPNKIGSLEVGWIFIDEAIELTEDDYVMLQGRLRLNTVPFRQLFMATNPSSGQHFLYKKFYLSGDADCHVIEANSLENPHNPEDYRQNLLKLKGRYFERYVLGRWIGFEGLVYDIVNPQTVIVESFEIPSHWPRYRSIDFGYTNPFVCQWWARCPDEEATDKYHGWYMYQELYLSQHTVAKLAPKIKSVPGSILNTYADHDAEDRATLEEHQILTTQADKAIGTGIQQCYEMFGDDQIHFFADVNMELDLVLSSKNRPTSTVEELSNYRWAAAKKDHNAKELPIDIDNHGMDAMRYLFQTLLGAPEPQHVSYRRSRQNSANRRDWKQFITTSRNWKKL